MTKMNLHAFFGGGVYIDTDPNHVFNSFLCTSLHIFQASFPVMDKSMNDKNDWITQGINIFQTQKKPVSLHLEQQ